MGAKQKLNVICFIACMFVAGLIGLLTDSAVVFVVVVGGLLGACMVSGQIR